MEEGKNKGEKEKIRGKKTGNIRKKPRENSRKKDESDERREKS